MADLKMKYFVLKPNGKSKYAAASRKALRAYAHHIFSINEDLAAGLLDWAEKESFISEEDIKAVRAAGIFDD